MHNQNPAKNYNACIFGATGLVGSHVLQQLIADPNCIQVQSFTRRPLTTVDGIQSKDKHKNHVIDFEQSLFSSSSEDQQRLKAQLSDQQQLYLCLGSTIKTAGSKSAFKRIDLDYSLKIAQLAQHSGVDTVALISAVGVDPNKYSPFFYNQVKAQLEHALIALQFKRLVIAQPSLLLGHRTEMRLFELLGQKIMPYANHLLHGTMAQYRAIEAHRVACALVAHANKSRSTEPAVQYLKYHDFATNYYN